jgi:hypothetical protein
MHARIDMPKVSGLFSERMGRPTFFIAGPEVALPTGRLCVESWLAVLYSAVVEVCTVSSD